MDLIYMNANREDIGVLFDYELDMAFGADENNFECTISAGAHCCGAGYYLYTEGTEYGGMIDGIESDSERQEVIYSGRTWHGILNAKIIEPDSGEAYLTLSGEANAVLGALIERMGLADLFTASEADSGVQIDSYKMNRYIGGYDGIKKMLASAGAKLVLKFKKGKAVLSAAVCGDYTNEGEFDSDQINFQIKKRSKTVNHLVCLGTGELENRTVIHLYADAEGNISQTQTLFGLDEYADVFDYPNVESEEELLRSGTETLQTQWQPAEVAIDFEADEDIYDIGDIVGAIDNITKTFVSAAITKKIVTIKDDNVTISYKVGD